MERIIIIEGESSPEAVRETLDRDGYSLLSAHNGWQGLTLLEREQVDLVITDFDLPGLDGVEFLQRLRLRKALAELEADVPQEAREAIDITFREMLNNAIEHGGKLGPKKYVEVSFTKLKRAVVYLIKDPGEGFDPSQLAHAAQSGADDPLQHFAERDAQGLRAGGFGILLAKNLVDEVIYNERGNKLMFVKYL